MTVSKLVSEFIEWNKIPWLEIIAFGELGCAGVSRDETFGNAWVCKPVRTKVRFSEISTQEIFRLAVLLEKIYVGEPIIGQ